MTDLSDGEIAALSNLAAKKSGQEVDWINIADALALTHRGLAERSREGWTITALGLKALAAAGTPETDGTDEQRER